MTGKTDNSIDYVHELQQAVARIQFREVNHEIELLEREDAKPSRVVRESFNDPAPIRSGYNEVPFSGGHPVAPDIASDRANGDFWPIFNNEWDLASIRGIARHFANTAYGQGILSNLRNYIVHTGFDYDATAIRGQNTPEQLVADVQRIIEKFVADNRWELSFEQEICDAEHIDGEAILALEQVGDQIRVRRAEPSWLTEPADKDYLERKMGAVSRLNWRYGIATDADDASNIQGYFIQWNGDAQVWRFYSPSRVIHLKSNTPRHVKRGLSDFSPVVTELADAIALNHRMSKGAAIQASIAMIIEAVAGSGNLGIGDSTNLGASLSRASGGIGQRLTSDGRYVSERRSDWSEGMVIDTKGKKFQAGPMAGTQAANFVQVLQSGLRAAGVRWNMPEHMISGDASNNNYASILESGSPFVRRIESEQERLTKAYERMLWSVLRMAFEAGRLNLRRYGMNWQDLKRCVNVIVTGTSPSVRNRSEDFAVDSQLFTLGILSGDSLATKYDWDPEEEREKGAKPQAVAVPGASGSPLPSQVPTLRGSQPSQASAPTQPPSGDATDQAKQDPDARLNGAQITAAKDVLADVAAGRTADLVGKELLQALGMDDATAKRMVDASKTVKQEEPPRPTIEQLKQSAKESWDRSGGRING